ncbi:hypothetical protein NC652_031297 [Populus alba x Populus x berolinensis]|nr:hypothetical protein NC652_031297 [Populus alba x Populus x berolinensis]
MAAVAEMARGANAPSVPPVWERHVLNATEPPRVTCRHRAYEEVAGSTSSILTHDHLRLQELSRKPIGYALELVRKAKADMTEEYLRSTASFDSEQGKASFTVPGTYIVSDLRRAGLEKVDFGMGKCYLCWGLQKPSLNLQAFIFRLQIRKEKMGSLYHFACHLLLWKDFTRSLKAC